MMFAMFALPQPNDGFEWVQAHAGQALVCRPLEAAASHLFTTRLWPFGSASSRDRADAWDDVAKALGVDRSRLARARQVHGAEVLVVHRGCTPSRSFDTDMARLPEADIVMSNDPAEAVAVQAADCVPLLVADRRTGGVAAAHAGWRGLAEGVPEVAVQRLAREFGSRPADLLAAIGPSIGACCYEVGEDVRARFESAGLSGPQLGRWFLSGPRASRKNPSMPRLAANRRRNHWFFDAWAATREQLESAGVPAGQIYVAELCTASHAETLCSARVEGSRAGRLAGAIRPPNQRPAHC